MNIPTFAYVPFVDDEGYLTSPMQMYNDELNRVLRNGLSDNGWTLPVVTKAELAQINAPQDDPQNVLPDGTIWAVQDDIDTTYREIVVKLDDGTGTGTSALYKLTKTAYP